MNDFQEIKKRKDTEETRIPAAESVEKKPRVESAAADGPARVQAVLLDIEGTTTSISFVADVLFAYIRRELDNYLRKHWTSEQLQSDVQALRELSSQDKAAGVDGVPEVLSSAESDADVMASVRRNVLWQMDADRKSTALKQLQGHMWKSAYESGEVKGHVYPDVVPALRRLKDGGVPIFIYSSGSIAAQRLLFSYSLDGDVQAELLAGNFDTTSGPKVEAASYRTIFDAIATPPPSEPAPSEPSASALLLKPTVDSIRNVLFLTDNILEARAAAAAGMSAALLDRPGNKPLPPSHEFVVLKSFSELFDRPELWAFS